MVVGVEARPLHSELDVRWVSGHTRMRESSARCAVSAVAAAAAAVEMCIEEQALRVVQMEAIAMRNAGVAVAVVLEDVGVLPDYVVLDPFLHGALKTFLGGFRVGGCVLSCP